MIPSDGMCVAVLNLASRHSDPDLATSAIQLLTTRRSSLLPFHYEALLAAYMGVKDLKTSFRILNIMAKAGHQPDASTTRPIYFYLSSSPELPAKAWQVLHDLHEDGHQIPIAAINVVLECCVAVGNYDDSINLYKQMHTICDRGPNTDTFNTLLQGCTRRRSKDIAMFLASEMSALNVKPDQLTYDRLILICLSEDDYEDAFLYLEEMKAVGTLKDEQRGWWMRLGTASALVRRCIAEGDDRGWHVLNEMEKRFSIVEKRLRTWAEQNWKGSSESKKSGLSGEEKLKDWGSY